ncbi:Sensor histidine kinase [Sulfidibacter corallicola]|uniref:histidine kinase n=1 Tax=Sulfidibacter corallicola TaxID=2818388 RepID=A0A8A4TS39_SULCO|nr:sensor histidine kinase [Sulfidibacter corallicola]QTD51882.1 sensor histidine kinase [Sulfidibacter corallicola]
MVDPSFEHRPLSPFMNRAAFWALISVYVAVYVSSYMENDLSLSQFLLMGLLGFLLLGSIQFSTPLFALIGSERMGFAVIFPFQVLLSFAVVFIDMSGTDPGVVWLITMPLMSYICFHKLRLPVLLACGLLVMASFLVPLGFRVGFEKIGLFTFEILPAYVFVVVFAQLAVREIAARNEKEILANELEAANRKLRNHAAQAEELAATRERNRLARDIHDSLGHYLTAVHMQAAAAQAVLDQKPETASAMLGQIQAMAKQGLEEVRHSVAALREDPLLGKEPGQMLRELATTCERDGIAVEIHVEGAERPLTAKVMQTLFRTAQEGLTNMRKYAEASRVVLRLTFDADAVTFDLEDDGRGADALQGGFGLTGIRERAQILGGRAAFVTEPGQGFHIQVVIPTGRAEGAGDISAQEQTPS